MLCYPLITPIVMEGGRRGGGGLGLGVTYHMTTLKLNTTKKLNLTVLKGFKLFQFSFNAKNTNTMVSLAVDGSTYS